MTVHSAERRIFRDLSPVAHGELGGRIIRYAQESGLPAISPGETMVTSAESEELNKRIQQIQALPDYQPHAFIATVTESADSFYRPYVSGRPPFSSLDNLINRQGPSVLQLDRMNDLELSRPSQVLLLRAVIIATTAKEWASRSDGPAFSERQQKLQRRAIFSLRHLATNRVHVPADTDEASQARFVAAYTASYLARAVETELHTQRRLSYSTTSVDEALAIPIPFGQLASGDQSEVIAIFPPGEKHSARGSEVPTLRAVYPVEIDEERIKRLRQLQHTFGGPFTEFRYFDTVKPFTKKKDKLDQGITKTKTEKDANKAQGDEDEHDYLILEISHPDPAGNTRIHVVADHPRVGNACYALREEVLDEWEHLVGIRLSWRDVYAQSRETARQLGARDFHHKNGSDVEKRVNNYLSQEAESMLHETFGKIFDRSAKLFDADMRPTEDNRMPQPMIEHIQASPILREKWASIYANGYAETMRTAAAVDRAQQRQREASVRRVSLRELAAALFAQIAAEDIELGR